LHARDPENGKPDPNPDLFMEFLPRIKQSTDAVMNISTGGGLGMTREERLRAAVRTSPEMASMKMGSINFGIFAILDKYSEWKHDWEPEFLGMTRDFIFRNTFDDIEYAIKELGQGHGKRFEFECYDLGHLYNLARMMDQGWIEGPIFVQMVFGILGGVVADLDNLMHMHTTRTNCLARITNSRFWPRDGIKCPLPRKARFWMETCAWGWKTAFKLASGKRRHPAPNKSPKFAQSSKIWA
jgi:uncharacterized protein (DUF849 family)